MKVFLSVLLLQTAPASAPQPASSPSPATAAPAPSAEDTFQGLQQVYATTCGQTGILYHAYDEICESLRKQIKSYREKIDREQAQAARATPKR